MTAYVRLTNPDGCDIGNTVKYNDSINIDYDEQNQPCGIHILNPHNVTVAMIQDAIEASKLYINH